MALVFEKFLKEENKKMLLLGAKVMNMHISGNTFEEIATSTGLPVEQVEAIILEFDENGQI